MLYKCKKRVSKNGRKMFQKCKKTVLKLLEIYFKF